MVYCAIDAAAPAGNEEGVQHSLALSVDTAAPSTTDDVPAAVQNGDRQVTLTALDSGPAGVGSTKFQVYTGGTPAKSDSGWLTYDASSKPTVHDGERIAYYSIDPFPYTTLLRSVQHSLALSVDTAAPSTTDDVPAAVQNGDRQVTLTALDSGPAG